MADTFIVAEIGINHNKDMNTAKELVRIAKESGADAVKFQLWKQKTFPHLEDYRLTNSQISELINGYAPLNGMVAFCTPFDYESVLWLDELGQSIWKIPSNNAVWSHDFMILAIQKAKNRKVTFVSTGLGSEYGNMELREMLLRMNKGDKRKTVCMYCISEYPTNPESYNFRNFIRDWGSPGRHLGFSDHSLSTSLPAAFVAKMGEYNETVIEKHLTLDRNQEGPDHCASLEPHEFRTMVENIREVEKAL